MQVLILRFVKWYLSSKSINIHTKSKRLEALTMQLAILAFNFGGFTLSVYPLHKKLLIEISEVTDLLATTLK